MTTPIRKETIDRLAWATLVVMAFAFLFDAARAHHQEQQHRSSATQAKTHQGHCY